MALGVEAAAQGMGGVGWDGTKQLGCDRVPQVGWQEWDVGVEVGQVSVHGMLWQEWDTMAGMGPQWQGWDVVPHLLWDVRDETR